MKQVAVLIRSCTTHTFNQQNSTLVSGQTPQNICIFQLLIFTFPFNFSPVKDAVFRRIFLPPNRSPVSVPFPARCDLRNTFILNLRYFRFFPEFASQVEIRLRLQFEGGKNVKVFFLYVPSLLIDSSTDMGVPPQRFSLLFFARKYAGTLRFTRILLQTGRFVLFHLERAFCFFFPFDKKIPPDVTIPL